MFVVKRDGSYEDIKFDKITERIRSLCWELDMNYIDPIKVAQKVTNGVVAGITTNELDILASQVASDMGIYHSDYQLLAGRIDASNLQKSTPKTFTEAMDILYNNKVDGVHRPIVSEQVYKVAKAYKDIFDDAIHPSRDFDFDIFGMETLKRSYLLRANEKIIETPQYMFMRVAVGLHDDDIELVLQTYTMMSLKYYIHSTPTLYNCGTPSPQLSSCFLLTTEDDSIDGIYDTIKECANISKRAGGIGFSIHDIRSTDSHVHGSNGKSSGIVPMLRVFNEVARHVDQGGKRKGAFAAYLEPHHSDIFEFIELRRQGGNLDFRTHDLFIAVWISDLFIERVKNDLYWTLFDPSIAKGLSDVYGVEYKKLYEKYESDGIGKSIVSARELWTAIMLAQTETGTPYIVNKDQANAKSNQKNLGTIKSSNLCCEILEYSSPSETAVCTLASINLSNLAGTIQRDDEFDFLALQEITKAVVQNLNVAIDKTLYPSEKAKRSNLKHRPIGIGVSGLQDVFFKLKLEFDSEEARSLNKKIFETIYRSAILASIEEAKIHGAYETFQGSPASEGILQFDMWGLNSDDLFYDDWAEIKGQIMMYGLRNSLLVALMPTASSATIMGVTEAFEIQTSNVYSRKTMSGEFSVMNQYLIKDLVELGLWNQTMIDDIIRNEGSIQSIQSIPGNIKKRYRTVWEISQSVVIDMAADRGPFICQTQSMNLFLAKPTVPKLSSMYLYAHSKGLKTLCYYLRRRATSEAVQFTIGKNDVCESCSA